MPRNDTNFDAVAGYVMDNDLGKAESITKEDFLDRAPLSISEEQEAIDDLIIELSGKYSEHPRKEIADARVHLLAASYSLSHIKV